MKVAIVKGYDSQCYECNCQVALGISDWVEVTPQELQLLRTWCWKHTKDNTYYVLIEHVDSITEVPLAINEILKDQAQEAVRAQKAKEQRELEKKQREERKYQKLLDAQKKSLEEKRALLTSLKKELGEE